MRGTLNIVMKYLPSRRGQSFGYETGVAMRSHIFSVHDGIFDPDCSACEEIFQKNFPEPEDLSLYMEEELREIKNVKG